VLNDHVRNVLNVSFGRSQNCLILESLHSTLESRSLYILLISRPLLYGVAVRRCRSVGVAAADY
jgi:hypothetical protein